MSLQTESATPGVFKKMGNAFLFPGEYVCDRLNIKDQDSRYLLRMFINLTVYGKIAVLIIMPFV